MTLIYDQRTRALLRQEPDIEIRKAVAADGTVTEYSRAQVVRDNFRKIAEGMPLTAREAELNRLGIPASQGGIWTARDPAQAGDEPGLHR